MVVVIMGLRRSGTTVLGDLLEAMGVRMGDDPLREDKEFIAAMNTLMQSAEIVDGLIKTGDPFALDELQRLIDLRCANHKDWGIKNFALNYLLPEFVRRCPSPVRVIRTERTFAESVNSYVCSGLTEWTFPQVIQNFANDLYNCDMNFDRHPGPKTTVNFHTLLKNPEFVVRSVARFCDRQFDRRWVRAVNPQHSKFAHKEKANGLRSSV